MDATDFFDLILPSTGLRCVATPGKKGMFQQFGPDNDWLAKASHHLDVNRQKDVYFACASFKDNSSRKQLNVAAVRAFWADIDCGPKKPYPNAKAGAAAVLLFAHNLGLPRPYLVASGRGVHAYWPMSADIEPKVWKTTALMLKAALREEGVEADPTRTADASSILRPPGTHHRKAEPKLVKLAVVGEVADLHAFQQALLPYAKFVSTAAIDNDDEFALPEGGPAAGFTGSNADLRAGVEHRPSSAHRMAERCAVMAEVRDTQGQVEEPLWYAALSVLARTTEGNDICHEWSQGDPRYTHAATQLKIDQAVANSRPALCDRFGQLRPTACAACQYAGKVKSPITLGVQEGETITVVETVKTANGFKTVPVAKEALDGYRFYHEDGRQVMQQSVWSAEENDGAGGFIWDTFSHTVVQPMTRLWIEGSAHMGCRMMVRPGEWRDFTVEGSLIGKGKDGLAGLLAQNEIVCLPGKERMMDGYLKRWMTHLKETADQVQGNTHFGWVEDSFVLGAQVITPQGQRPAILQGTAKSKAGALAPVGSLDRWIEVIDAAYNHVGQEDYQFLVLQAFAAPLLSLIGNERGVTVYAHSEASGTGKTTAQRAGLSAWGNWDDLMLADAKVTQNALWGIMGAYHSLPIVFDELTNMPNNVASELVFSVSSGRSKQRLRADGELRENNSGWATIMLASGNNLLSEKLSLHRGNAEAEISRLFEFTMRARPHLSPNEANRLFPDLLTNYGHAGAAYAAYVVQHRAQVIDLLKATQEKLNTAFGLTMVERYWSALFACSVTALSICRSLGLLQFEMRGLTTWLRQRLAENRGGRAAYANDPLELFGVMLSDVWEGVLVTQGEGDLRVSGGAAFVQKHPRGTMVGRSILPRQGKNDKAVLLLNANAVRDWANKKGVSAAEMFKALVAAGWASSEFTRYSLGRGTVEYSQSSSYVQCWKLDPERVAGSAAGGSIAQKLGVIDGGLNAAAGSGP